MKEDCLKVFIVDDEDSVLDWMKENVKWEDYNFQLVGCALEASVFLKYLEQNSVDLLITDISMPGMTGLDLIRIIKERHSEVLVTALSAYDNFAYVKEAFLNGIVDYCLKPIDINEIYEVLKSVEKVCRERQLNHENQDMSQFHNSVLQRIISGNINSSRIDEQCELAGIRLESLYCQVIVIGTSNLEHEYCVFFRNKFDSKYWEKFYCFWDEYMNLVLLYLGDELICEDDLIKKLQDVLHENKVAGRVSFSIGKVLKNYRYIPISYQMCCDFLNARDLIKENINLLEPFPYEKYINTLKGSNLRLLENSIKMKRQDSVIRAIKSVVNNCQKEEDKKRELICLLVFLVRNFREMFTDKMIPIPEEPLCMRMSSIKIIKWLEMFCEKAMVQERTLDETVHPYVSFALKAISERYADSALSLQMLAEECNVSSAYMGRLFKEQVGEFFNDYMQGVRLKMAERLLYENVLRIGEIATAVGFANQSYFIKVFRKSFGLSPAEYRRKCFEQNEKI